MKIVLDNNVFISATFWHGPPHQILQLAEAKKLKIYATSEILDELFGVLKRKKFDYLFEEGRTSREEVFQKWGKIVYLCQPSIKVEGIVDDPKDNKFLSCALACGANFIISGDKHLLDLKEFRGIPILKPQGSIEYVRSKK